MAPLVAMGSGGADTLAGALVVIALLALARAVIRTAGGSGPEDEEQRPVPPP
jgi:hypothetical protein